MHNQNPAAEGSRIRLFTEGCKVVKQFLLIGTGITQMIRVPLNRHTEGMVCQFDGFHSAVFCPGVEIGVSFHMLVQGSA